MHGKPFALSFVQHGPTWSLRYSSRLRTHARLLPACRRTEKNAIQINKFELLIRETHANTYSCFYRQRCGTVKENRISHMFFAIGTDAGLCLCVRINVVSYGFGEYSTKLYVRIRTSTVCAYSTYLFVCTVGDSPKYFPNKVFAQK